MAINIINDEYYRGVTFCQVSEPVTGMVHGDTWLDSNGVLKVYNGVTWESFVNVPAQADFTVDDDTTDVSHAVQFIDKSLGDIVSWLWDFGDGNTGTDQNPTHQYTANGQYDVTLTVTDSGGNQDTKTITNCVTVANDPGASFVASTTAEHINTNIQFTDQSTSSGTITAWQWDFGDGTTSTNQNPVHQYTTSGLYTVSLTVTDEYGSDTMTRTNYIAIDVPPMAEFTSDTQSAFLNENITFTDQSTSYGTISSWQWNFGDGTTSTAQNPVHSYSATGNYTISLTVTDEFGNDIETKSNYITISAYGTGYEYGYAMGGYNGSNRLSTIDRITFPFDSGTAAYVGDLNNNKDISAGCNSTNYGYYMGGYDDGSNYLSTIDRITFPFDSGTATHVGNLSQGKYGMGGFNSSNYGYAAGGHLPGLISTIDRITFPFDSGTATYVGNLSNSRCHAGECNSSNYGYIMGGYSYLSTIDRITFPFDSGTATHVGNLSSESNNTSYVTGCNSSNYGYADLGHWGEHNIYSFIDRITFPFDSGTGSYVGNLSGTRSLNGGCNSTNYGYYMGGEYYNGSDNVYLSIIDRITFPFDSGTAAHVGNLSGNRDNIAGCDGTDFVTLFI